MANLEVIIRPSDGTDEMVLRSPDAYLPVPPNDKTCPFSGRGHHWFYKTIINGPARKHIRLIHDIQPKGKRGTWMYHIGDLIDFLNGLAEAQKKQSNNPK